MAIFASSIAKFFHMHLLGPPPNGKIKAGLFVAFNTPSENLEGGQAPPRHFPRFFHWDELGLLVMRAPHDGKCNRPPIFTSSLINRVSTTIGGYNKLRTSYKIIVT